MRKTLYAALLILCSSISAWTDELPDRLFLQGPAAIYNEWNDNNPLQYQKNEFSNMGDGFFRYVGKLNADIFKINLQDKGWGTWTADGTDDVVLEPNGNWYNIIVGGFGAVDKKWKINTEGLYMITVDANTMKIKCEACPSKSRSK